MSEELLALAREVNSKGFEERLERLVKTTGENAASTRKLSREKGNLTRREAAVSKREDDQAVAEAAFVKNKARHESDLDARRAQLVKAEFDAQSMKDAAAAELQAAKQNLAEARRIRQEGLDLKKMYEGRTAKLEKAMA